MALDRLRSIGLVRANQHIGLEQSRLQYGSLCIPVQIDFKSGLKSSFQAETDKNYPVIMTENIQADSRTFSKFWLKSQYEQNHPLSEVLNTI